MYLEKISLSDNLCRNLSENCTHMCLHVKAKYQTGI